jgi:hypothetical protein
MSAPPVRVVPARLRALPSSMWVVAIRTSLTTKVFALNSNLFFAINCVEAFLSRFIHSADCRTAEKKHILAGLSTYFLLLAGHPMSDRSQSLYLAVTSTSHHYNRAESWQYNGQHIFSLCSKSSSVTKGKRTA